MCDHNVSCTPGTLVWFKVHNRIWWPAKMIDPATAPNELQYYMNRKKHPIGMVYFESDDKYDIIINMDKVALYSCTKKMQYVEKGYSLYIRQKNGAKLQSLNMVHFVDDVLKFEKEINGDINIFKNFEKKKEDHIIPHRELLIKELFVSSKQIKKKETNRKSIASSNNFNSLNISKNPNLKKCVSSTQMSGTSDPKLTCHLKPECNFTTNCYDVLKHHMALCKTTVEDKTKKNEFNINTLFQTPNKRKNTTYQDNTKKSKIYYKLDDGENQDDIESLNHNREPGCSTNIIENKNVINLVKDFDFDEIKKSDENATENIKIFKNARTIENFDIQKEYFNHSNSSDSSDYEELLEDLKLIVNERLNSYRGSTDSKINNNIALNVTKNTINNIIGIDNSDKQLKNSNHSTDFNNDYCFDLVCSSETVQHIDNEPHQLIEPVVDGSSREQDPILDQNLFLNETCSKSTGVIVQSEIEALEISLEEMILKNKLPFNFEISSKQEQAGESFINDIINGTGNDNLYPNNENLYPNNEIALKNVNEMDDKKEHCQLNLLQPDEWLEENLPNVNHAEFLKEELKENKLLPSCIEHEVIQLPKVKHMYTDEELRNLPEFKTMDTYIADLNGPPWELQLIECIQTPQEKRTPTEPMIDKQL